MNCRNSIFKNLLSEKRGRTFTNVLIKNVFFPGTGIFILANFGQGIGSDSFSSLHCLFPHLMQQRH